MKNFVQRIIRLIALTSFFLKNRTSRKNKIVFDTDEISLECKSCKINLGCVRFHWRHKEKQLDCPNCNESTHEDYFFCNVCATGQNTTTKECLNVECITCEKKLGLMVFDDTPDMKPCSVCNHDVVDDSFVAELCVQCRGLHN
jgi:hypothetical protein